MSLYERWIFPRILDLTMRNQQVTRYRKQLVPQAKGQVLEIGMGSGLNLPLRSRGRATVRLGTFR